MAEHYDAVLLTYRLSLNSRFSLRVVPSIIIISNTGRVKNRQ